MREVLDLFFLLTSNFKKIMDYEIKDFTVDVIQASHNKPVLVDFCG